MDDIIELARSDRTIDTAFSAEAQHDVGEQHFYLIGEKRGVT